jgi:hypothetical protein
VHNPIPEYVSTASISTVMTMPFRLIPFEKKVFEEVVFLLKYHQNPQNPQETENNKRRERKIIEKVRKKEEKKAQTVSSNKGEVNILREEKHFNIKISFFM